MLHHAVLQIFTIILISILYGVLGFLYSFFGLFEQSNNNIIILEPFRLITFQELGGHFLFGVIVAIPSKNIKFILLAGLMALSIDSDHLLNVAGFHVQGRLDHSILFAVLSSIVIGLIAGRIYHKVWRGNTITINTIYDLNRFRRRYEKVDTNNNKKHTSNTKLIDDDHKDKKKNNNEQLSSLFFIITLAAFFSHIAYDAFVDDKALFPLLVPFSFNEIFIPRMYSLPIEAAGFLLVYLYYSLSLRYSIFTSKKKTSATV
jgi:hypothetical protein